MKEWSAGYVADVGYTYGYYNELNPLRLGMAFLDAGLVFPEVGTACELGFGQGLSVNMHAAASTTSWFGNDFNPAQAGFAQELARVSGAAARLSDAAFSEFCHRPDLPDFDFIALHGIWSWISDENRAVIVDFVRRKLKVGGVLYVSYNTQPGWAPMVPMRDLLALHTEVLGAKGEGALKRIDEALAFADKLMDANPLYARGNPQVAHRLQKLKEQDRSYLAHEYFNRDWLPMPFSKMADWLGPAKLTFACSAHYFDHVDALNLTTEQQGLLRDIPDPVFRETVRDFCVNQQFRRDYWVKGLRRSSAQERVERTRALRVVLVKPRAGVPLKANGGLGELALQETVYTPVLDVLADHQPKSLAQIEQAVKGHDLGFAHVVQALMVLVGMGAVHLAQEDAVVERCRVRTNRLNACLAEKAQGSGDIAYFASPVTGGGVSVNRFAQLFLLARSRGMKTPAEWASFAWSLLSSQGHRLRKEGRPLEGDAEHLAELTEQAAIFMKEQLPILQGLQVA